MDSTALDRLTQRLDRLERENRRLKRIGGVAVIGLAAVALMGQTMPGKVAKVVEAEQFVLRDASGTIRGRLHTSSNGIAGLFLSSGTASAGLRVGADGLAILAMSEHGEPRVVLGNHKNSPEVLLIDKSNKVRVKLEIEGDGEPRLALYDGARQPRVAVGTQSDGGPGVVLLDENGRLRAALGSSWLEQRNTGAVEERPDSSLVLFDKDGKVIWQAP